MLFASYYIVSLKETTSADCRIEVVDGQLVMTNTSDKASKRFIDNPLIPTFTYALTYLRFHPVT